MPKAQAQRRKHVPIRTCVVCRQAQGKRELIRIVRTAQGNVQVDPTGKMAGRGAYLCRDRSCWDQALTGNRLGAALRAQLSTDDLAALKAFAETLPVSLATEA